MNRTQALDYIEHMNGTRPNTTGAAEEAARQQAYAQHNGLTPSERAAIAAVRLAHATVADAALNCHQAGLTGTEVKDALREASQALLRLVQVIEGKT